MSEHERSDALGAVARALHDDAQQAADAERATGRAEAASLEANAAAEAERIVAQASAAGATIAARAVALALAAARRTARETVLAAQRRGYDLVRRAVLDEIASRRDSVAVRALVGRLGDAARERLGSGAQVHPLPGGRIGAMAETESARVEAGVDVLVDRALNEHPERVSQLWA